jgi:2-hydroxychromene-2-carboxylate isomerase
VDLRFYYDISCPYASIATTRVEALAAAHGARLIWEPILLGGLFQHHQTPDQYQNPPPPRRLSYNAWDIHAQAARHGFPLRWPSQHPRRTVDAMRLLRLAPMELRPALTADLVRAYWIEDIDVSDPAWVDGLARRHGIDPAGIRLPAIKEELRSVTAAAAERGIFGVPVLEVGERWWWGNDRFHFAAAALGGAPPPERSPSAQSHHIEIFHDFASPFSCLGASRIEALAQRHGARLTFTPILLGALFRSIGTPDVPLFAMHAARQQYQARDLLEWAAHWGLPFRWPSDFPIRSVLPLRVSILEPRARAPIYRAQWAEDHNTGDPAVLAGVLEDAGLDPGLIARADEARDQLRANTERARELGVFGVPTMLLDGRWRIWGQDRLDTLDAALAGEFTLPDPELL